MTRIDTPFVGGVSSPRRREAPDSELARPYSTGEEPTAPAPQGTPEPSAGELDDGWETAPDDTLTEAPSPEEELEAAGRVAEEPSIPAEAVMEPEPEVESLFDFVQADEPAMDAEAALSVQPEAPDQELGVPVESLGDDFEFDFESSIETPEPVLEASPESPEPAVVPGLEAGPVSEPTTIAPEDVASAMVEPSEEEGEGGVDDTDEGFPDFLFGDDAADEAKDVGSAAEAAGEAISDFSPFADAEPAEEDDLTRAADELSHGAHSDRIRALRESLKDEQADDIVSRAFAAGYLAARDEEQEDR